MDNLIGRDLSEYVAWLIRNAYEGSGLNGDMVDCHNFKIIINGDSVGVKNDELCSSLLGFEVFVCFSYLQVAVDLLIKPESLTRDVKKFAKHFHEMQELYPFTCDTWKSECGI